MQKFHLPDKTRFVLFLTFCILSGVHAQDVLPLKEAVSLAIDNYGSIKAKNAYYQASGTLEKEARRTYLPDITVGARNDYGTVNGLYGPSFGFGGSGLASSGPVYEEENWDAAFGSLYFASFNWEVFAFGKARQRTRTAEAATDRDSKDWQQEIFQHKIKVAATYLQVVAAHQLVLSYRKNLERAETFRNIVIARTRSGLIAGVDSLQANAEYSNARITLTKAIDNEQEQSNNLSRLMGVLPDEFIPDTLFISRIPMTLDRESRATAAHPVLQWYESRVNYSDTRTKFLKASFLPSVNLVGVIQTRGSGFFHNYTPDNEAFTGNYWDGIEPKRANYLLGIGINWNITEPFRGSQRVKAQKYLSRGLRDEYEQARQQIEAQLKYSEQKIRNSLDNYKEAPVQVNAAREAYHRQTVLYENGLTDLNTVTQALYALVRAETDRDIAYNNVWQALLLKAAATGDFGLFEDQL
ncbi:TolC family protein [Sinomicrobium pectinilyticum]|uniref:TolC family protein n=1 Tax=Sinomicrobium pectinilyticum TaxID=1084421 RepID=A0A3N0DYK1_SINP1|nr:TolC family protein [Sinomicrobium pectinilyticum]RNL80684.1 TolC family protein [Sinomicrobium pectinilyticum]